MRSHWILAPILGSALLVACGTGATDNPANSLQDQESSQPPAVANQGAVSQGAASPVKRTPPPSGNQTQPRTVSTQTVKDEPAAPQWREVTLPAGTALSVEMTTSVSSETAQVETPVTGRIQTPVIDNGHTVIAAGSVLTGTVTDVDRPGRVQGRALLTFRFTDLKTDDGSERVATNPVTFEGEATKSEDATKIGVGAAGGAIIGGLLGGKGGAGKGAAAGAAAGTGVVLATRGKDVVVSEGSAVTVTLAQPLTLRVALQ